MENREFYRQMTEASVMSKLINIGECYMKVYDEYYETYSRDSAFLKDLVDCLQGIEAVLDVYTRDKSIHPSYALEHLKSSKSYIDSAIRYYEYRLEKRVNNE